MTGRATRAAGNFHKACDGGLVLHTTDHYVVPLGNKNSPPPCLPPPPPCHPGRGPRPPPCRGGGAPHFTEEIKWDGGIISSACPLPNPSRHGGRVPHFRTCIENYLMAWCFEGRSSIVRIVPPPTSKPGVYPHMPEVPCVFAHTACARGQGTPFSMRMLRSVGISGSYLMQLFRSMPRMLQGTESRHCGAIQVRMQHAVEAGTSHSKSHQIFGVTRLMAW